MNRLLACIVGLMVVVVLAYGVAGCATTKNEARPGDVAQTNTADPADAERRARVRLELASAYFGRGQSSTALDEVKLALAAKPDLPEAFNLRGLVYASMGQGQLAEESFQRALQLSPRDADTLHNFGWYLCQQRRYPAAEQYFQQALAQPQYATATRTMLAMGVCQARAGQWPQAEQTLSRSYELDPASPVTAFNLAEVLLRRGELERARFYARRINAVPEQSNAQSLWLAVRIEQRIERRNHSTSGNQKF